MYDHAALAEDTSETFKREVTIYNDLGSHEYILSIARQSPCHPLCSSNQAMEMAGGWQ